MAPKNKGGASKDKGKGKVEAEEKATKVKGAQQINVRHILVCIFSSRFWELGIGEEGGLRVWGSDDLGLVREAWEEGGGFGEVEGWC